MDLQPDEVLVPPPATDPRPFVARIARQVRVTTGPLPSPEVLAGYKAIDPTLVNRIMVMAEKSIDQRLRTQQSALEAEITDTRAWRLQIRWGQWLGFGIAVSGLFGSVFTTVHGYPVAGTALGGGTLVSLVGAFLYSHRPAVHRSNPDRPS